MKRIVFSRLAFSSSALARYLPVFEMGPSKARAHYENRQVGKENDIYDEADDDNKG